MGMNINKMRDKVLQEHIETKEHQIQVLEIYQERTDESMAPTIAQADKTIDRIGAMFTTIIP